MKLNFFTALFLVISLALILFIVYARIGWIEADNKELTTAFVASVLSFNVGILYHIFSILLDELRNL